MLGFKDSSQREKSIQLLIEAIDHADCIRAEIMIVHAGEVPF